MTDYEKIGKAICNTAKERFITCQAEKDYCIQTIDETVIVFGSTNRIVFGWGWRNPKWRIERSYCTDRFITEWDLHY